MHAHSENPTIRSSKTQLSFRGVQAGWRSFFFGGFMRICKIPGCKYKYSSKGYCNMHYHRFVRYGDPLFFRQIHERHGMVNIPEYGSWEQMKARCYNKNHKAYNRYGGREIIICNRWLHSFAAFYKDMGPKPFPKAQIDRKDNDGNYESGNCRWVTNTQNNQNRSNNKLTMSCAIKIRLMYRKKDISQRGLARIYSVNQRLIFDIIHNKKWVMT